MNLYEKASFAEMNYKPTTEFLKGATDPGALVIKFYEYALGIVGIVALGVIIYGAILWIVSTGNPSKIQEAKSWIMGAIWGITLLLGATLILRTINPRLAEIGKIESAIEGGIKDLKIKKGTAPDILSNFNFNDSSTTASGYTSLYTGSWNDVPLKPGICGGNTKNCKIETDLASRLGNLNASLGVNGFGSGNWQVTEAYPPTYQHESQCHNDGSCVDANLVGASPTFDNIVKFQNTASQAGLKAVYEVTDKATLDKLLAQGVDPKLLQYNPKASASHFHITKI